VSQVTDISPFLGVSYPLRTHITRKGLVMSTVKGNGRGQLDYLHAADRQIAATEESHAVMVEVYIRRSVRTGVFQLNLEAIGLLPRDAGRVVAAYRLEWPNVNVASFEAQLFQATGKLDGLCEVRRVMEAMDPLGE
jgi:hypothetical protein